MSEEIFEGDDVNDFVVALPTGTVEAARAYPHGTLLSLALQARVKGVRVEEDRKGNKVRKHILAVDEAVIVDSLTPSERRAIIEAAADEDHEPDEVSY